MGAGNMSLGEARKEKRRDLLNNASVERQRDLYGDGRCGQENYESQVYRRK